MKTKKIPADIRSKSIKEAQAEIKEIIDRLENSNTNLEDSMESYNRMLQLNHHVQDQFRQKAKEIKKINLKTKKKNSK
tara:strand:- start:857 stop:1090 length:234 start_codon:yes stop_codon:yes gene_type:complete